MARLPALPLAARHAAAAEAAALVVARLRLGRVDLAPMPQDVAAAAVALAAMIPAPARPAVRWLLPAKADRRALCLADGYCMLVGSHRAGDSGVGPL